MVDYMNDEPGTLYFENSKTPAPLEFRIRRLLQNINQKPLHRSGRIPWTCPQVWPEKLVHPEFPYYPGQLAAIQKRLSWQVRSNPARAKPNLD